MDSPLILHILFSINCLCSNIIVSEKDVNLLWYIHLSDNERCEQFAQVAYQKWTLWANLSGRSPKWTTMSDSVRLLAKNERCERIVQVAYQKWVNRSFFLANRSFAHFFAENERFAQKTDERIPSPGKRYALALNKFFTERIKSDQTLTLFNCSCT